MELNKCELEIEDLKKYFNEKDDIIMELKSALRISEEKFFKMEIEYISEIKKNEYLEDKIRDQEEQISIQYKNLHHNK